MSRWNPHDYCPAEDDEVPIDKALLSMARSAGTDADTLWSLAKQDCPLLREAVARNRSTPFETVEMLTADESRIVRNAALRRLHEIRSTESD